MNSVAVIILAALLGNALINLLADRLNLNRLGPDIPLEFRGIYDTTRYRQSQNYLRVNTRFNWIANGTEGLLVLIFWFAKGFPLLDQWVLTFQWGPVASGLLFIGALFGLKAAVGLPFQIYATFVIEERFGFNKTSPKTFITDLVKVLVLSILLGGPLLAGVLAFFQHAGNNAWWYCWAAATLYLLAVQYIFPTVILPLFNRFEPLEDGELKNAILDYADSIRFPLGSIMVMDGSRRSTKSNAFFTGFGRHKRIVLFDTLVARHPVSELMAILAHEMGHFKKKHIKLNLVAAICQMGIVFYLLSWFIAYPGLFDAFYMPRVSTYAGLVFFGILFTPIELAVGIMMRVISRAHEFAADRFAVQTTRSRRALIGALKKLAADNLSNLDPHPFFVFLHYSHPPVLERIRSILKN